jgi:hypothetical protein
MFAQPECRQVSFQGASAWTGTLSVKGIPFIPNARALEPLFMAQMFAEVQA